MASSATLAPETSASTADIIRMKTRPIIGLHVLITAEIDRRRVEGVLNYAEEKKITLRDFNYVTDYNPDPDTIPPWRGKVDGMVIMLGRAPNVVEWLKKGQAPCVNMGADLCNDLSSVFLDPHSLVQVAYDYFRKISSPNMAYVGYRAADGSLLRAKELSNLLRHDGRRLWEYQTKCRFTGTAQDYNNVEEVEPALLRFLRKVPKPVGLLAMSDRWAAALCRIVLDLGFSIPQDFAIMGVGDSTLSRFSVPPISSVRTPCIATGYEAAKMLHQMLQCKKPRRKNRQVPVVEIAERQSTIGIKRAASTDISAAMEFIRLNACEPIRIEDVAAAVHVPLRTFELEFAAAMGSTVGAEIRRLKIERVKNLLVNTELPLTTIAQLVGINDASYLSNFFRRFTGNTPAKFRKQHQIPNDAQSSKKTAKSRNSP